VAPADRRPEGQAATARELVRAVRGVRAEGWGNPLGYAFVAPALIIYLVFNVWPIVRGLAMAFTDYRFLVPGSEWSFNGLDNYVEMFTNDQLFWHSFRVGLTYTLLSFPAGLLLSLGVAALIAQIHSPRAAATYRVIAYLPVVLPIAVAMLLWRQLYHVQFGYINYLLKAVLGVAEPPNWLGDAHWALLAVAVAGVWKAFGGDMLLFLIGIYGINRELYEAAAIDGANGLRQFWHITLPLLKPIFVLILALNAGIVSATEEVLVLTNGDPANATLTVGLYVYRTAFQMGDLRLGYAASMSLLLGLIHMALAGLVFKLLRTERA
jgi:multiple sugar transport system permease protein